MYVIVVLVSKLLDCILPQLQLCVKHCRTMELSCVHRKAQRTSSYHEICLLATIFMNTRIGSKWKCLREQIQYVRVI